MICVAVVDALYLIVSIYLDILWMFIDAAVTMILKSLTPLIFPFQMMVKIFGPVFGFVILALKD